MDPETPTGMVEPESHPDGRVEGETVRVRELVVTVEQAPARVFVGGRGPPVLLVHGGWGGASLHWSSVLDPLSERVHVIAPDLPGIGDARRPGLGSLSAYAHWLRSLLDALRVPSAWLVGNSFGVSVACRFALDFPDRARGLVFVNGFPMPRTPAPLRWLGEQPLGQRLMQTIERRVAYSPRALRRGFFDATRVPTELSSLVEQKRPPQVSVLAKVMVRGGGTPATYRSAPLLLWGREDHLPGTSERAARRLHASWPGSELVFVPRAGHLPQVENPPAFAAALLGFVERHDPGA